MKSCLFILIAVLVLAALALSLGTIFFISSDTKIAEPAEVKAVEEAPVRTDSIHNSKK